jgi:plasmid stabilization system protein ParE
MINAAHDKMAAVSGIHRGHGGRCAGHLGAAAKIGRPVSQGLRELVISRGKSGDCAVYDYDEQNDMVLVLALRHQREAGYR